MKVSLRLIPLVFTLSKAATVINNLQINSHNATNATYNITTLGTFTDPRFRIEALWDQPKLRTISCLMNAVNVLAVLAQLDFLSKVMGIHRITIDNYLDVEIGFQPVSPAIDIEVRFLVWGLYAGIDRMVTQSRWNDAEFDLIWEERHIAWIRFERGQRLVEAENRLAILGQASTNALNETANTNATSSNGVVKIIIIYFNDGETIPLETLFMIVMAALHYLAEFSASDIVQPFDSSADGFDGIIRFFPGEPPKPSPQTFDYRAAIKAISQIPTSMLEHQKFAESAIVIKMDGVVVATGLIEKKAGSEFQYEAMNGVKTPVNISVA